MKRSLMLSSLSLLLLCSCGGGGSPSASAPSNSGVDSKIQSGPELAKRGPIVIHQGFIDLVKEVNPSLGAQVDVPAGKKRLVDSLIEQELLYQESVKRGIPNQAKYQNKAALYQRAIYAQALIEDEIDKRAQTYYDKNKTEEFSEVKLAQILVRPVPPPPTADTKPKTPDQQKADQAKSEADALKKIQEASQKLKGGAKWEEVVNEYSDDRMSKTHGGEIGKISKKDPRAARLEWQALIDQAFSMKAGDVSEPIKAKDGYHIIKVIEVAQVAPFNEVETKIKFKLRTEVKDELIKNMSGGSAVEYIDVTLKEEAKPKAPEEGAANPLTLPPGAEVKKPMPPEDKKEDKKPELAPKPETSKPAEAAPAKP